MSLQSKISDFLNGFESAEALATECRKRNLRGYQCSPHSCIVGSLIKDEFKVADIEVQPAGNDDCFPGHLYVDDEDESVEMTESANDFAIRFDNGAYRDLVVGRSFSY